MNAALEFLSGNETDSNGFRVDQYLKFSAHDWEGRHNIIQWAFPTRTPSAFNPFAPILPDKFEATVEQFTNVGELFKAYLKSMRIDIGRGKTADSCWGFELVPGSLPPWVRLGDHNYKRFSRIIECLMAFELYRHAEDFHDWLVFDFAVQHSEHVDTKTVAFWTATWQCKQYLLKG